MHRRQEHVCERGGALGVWAGEALAETDTVDMPPAADGSSPGQAGARAMMQTPRQVPRATRQIPLMPVAAMAARDFPQQAFQGGMADRGVCDRYGDDLHIVRKRKRHHQR